MNLGDIGDAFKITFTNLQVAEKSRQGDTAVVTMSGKMKMEFDKAKMKELVRKAAAAAGQTMDDAQLEMALSMLSGLSGTEQDVNEDLTLKQEGGKWLVCE